MSTGKLGCSAHLVTMPRRLRRHEYHALRALGLALRREPRTPARRAAITRATRTLDFRGPRLPGSPEAEYLRARRERRAWRKAQRAARRLRAA